jgi:hypothetical protein
MADRADWEQATRQQRHLAVAADAELRRRHPDQHYPPLPSAEPVPATQAQRDELTLTAGEEIQGAGQWIKELAVQRREFKDRLSERRCLLVPADDPDYEYLGQAFPRGKPPAGTRSCSRPSLRCSLLRGYRSVSLTVSCPWRPPDDSGGCDSGTKRCRRCQEVKPNIRGPAARCA